jgi:hypothetical protein
MHKLNTQRHTTVVLKSSTTYFSHSLHAVLRYLGYGTAQSLLYWLPKSLCCCCCHSCACGCCDCTTLWES